VKQCIEFCCFSVISCGAVECSSGRVHLSVVAIQRQKYFRFAGDHLSLGRLDPHQFLSLSLSLFEAEQLNWSVGRLKITMGKRRRSSSSDSSSSSSSSSSEEEEKRVARSSVSSSTSSDEDDEEWNQRTKAKKRTTGKSNAKPRPSKKVTRPSNRSDSEDDADDDDSDKDDVRQDSDGSMPNTSSKRPRGRNDREEGEVDDDEDAGHDDDEDEFNDGYDENLMGDDDDQQRLALMTEKEREQELFNRSEKREVLKTRFEIEKKLRLAKKKEQGLTGKSAPSTGSNKSQSDSSAFAESRTTDRRKTLESNRKIKDGIKALKGMRFLCFCTLT
jgi:RNA polymerase-associated protein RTF1